MKFEPEYGYELLSTSRARFPPPWVYKIAFTCWKIHLGHEKQFNWHNFLQKLTTPRTPLQSIICPPPSPPRRSLISHIAGPDCKIAAKMNFIVLYPAPKIKKVFPNFTRKIILSQLKDLTRTVKEFIFKPSMRVHINILKIPTDIYFGEKQTTHPINPVKKLFYEQSAINTCYFHRNALSVK